MKFSIGYAIGMLLCFLFHELYFDSKKECKDFHGIEKKDCQQSLF